MLADTVLDWKRQWLEEGQAKGSSKASSNPWGACSPFVSARCPIGPPSAWGQPTPSSSIDGRTVC